jgi:hypothetical protein
MYVGGLYMSADNVGLVAALVVAGSAVLLAASTGLIKLLKRSRQWEGARKQVLGLGLAVFLVSAFLCIVMYGTALLLLLRKR